MTPKILASCPECGAENTELQASEIQIIDFAPPHYEGLKYELPDSQYRFLHQECGRIAVKEANKRVKDLLLVAGCETVMIDYPDELLESTRRSELPLFTRQDQQIFRSILWGTYTDELLDPARNSSMPNISSDDLLDFHMSLENAGWLSEIK